MKRAVLLLSGGVDSVTALAQLVDQGYEVHCLIFDYDQTLFQETGFARRAAAKYGMPQLTLKIPFADVAPECSLFTNDMPTGRTREKIAASGTPPSYVPFRNGVMLSYAVAYGEARGIELIVAGANGLDSGNYWDDTFAFAFAFGHAANAGTSPDYHPRVHFPWANMAKGHVVSAGIDLGVEYSRTWSCYRPQLEEGAHCGECDSCVQRREALAANGLDIEGVEL